MAVPNRYNGGGPMAGVVIEGVSDGAGNIVPMPAGTAGSPTYVKAGGYTQLGYQQITAATLATSTPLTVPPGATTAFFQNNTTQPIRWRPDGATSAPTTTVGQRIPADSGNPLTLDLGNAGLTSSRFILEAAATGTADITYYA